MDTVQTIIAAIGLLVAFVPAWIAWKQYKDDQALPVVNVNSEWRILRALVNEEGGRRLEVYRHNDFYKKSLVSLMDKKLIYEGDQRKFFLTTTGKKVVKKHLREFLKKKASR